MVMTPDWLFIMNAAGATPTNWYTRLGSRGPELMAGKRYNIARAYSDLYQLPAPCLQCKVLSGSREQKTQADLLETLDGCRCCPEHAV